MYSLAGNKNKNRENAKNIANSTGNCDGNTIEFINEEGYIKFFEWLDSKPERLKDMIKISIRHHQHTDRMENLKF